MSVTLVVGATGLVGSEVCKQLAAAGQAVRALVRTPSDPGKVRKLEADGVEIMTGDLRDRASLAAACRGVDAVITTASSMPFAYVAGENDIRITDWEGVMRLIDVAKAAGVGHFVYTSFSGHIDLPFPLHDAKRAVESHLRQSGMSFTILRPGYFMEVWLSPAVGFDAVHAKVVVYGDGSRPLSLISVPDVAKFAVASLTNPAARNATLELGGPQALAPLEVVKIFEELTGRTFNVHFVPVEALEAQQAAAGDPMLQSFSGLMRCYAAGDSIEMSALREAFPFPLRTVKEYAAQMAVMA